MTKNARSIRRIGPISVIERREASRFKVDWTIKVSPKDTGGPAIEDVGILRDISSTGAYGLFTDGFEVGSSVRVLIQLPLQRLGWISYPAKVLRIEPWDSGVGLAFVFDAIRPSFVLGDQDQGLPQGAPS
jgi:hypothetical protein